MTNGTIQLKKIALILAGCLLGVFGIGFAAAGGTLLWAYASQRDADGFYTTPVARLVTPTYAYSSSVDFGTAPTENDWVPLDLVGTVRIRVSSPIGQAVFVGIGPTANVEEFLRNVAHERVSSIGFAPFVLHSDKVRGTRAPGRPAAEPFWVVSASGRGTETVRWPSTAGSWTAVVMSASGAPGIALDVDIGTNTGAVEPIGTALAAIGLVLLLAGVLMVVAGVREKHPPPGAAESPPSTPAAPGAPGPDVVPLGAPASDLAQPER